MLDGSSLGAFMIGLEVARRSSESAGPSVRPSRRSRRTRSHVRAPLAIALRSVANRLDRSTSAGLGSSSSAA
jgi:hypothetical protein